MDTNGQLQAGGLLSWLGGSKNGRRGGPADVGKDLDQIRRELFDLYTSVGLVAGGAGIPVEQLPLLQALLRSLRSSLEVTPEPGADRESELRSELTRLSAALAKGRQQFDDIVNAMEILGIPARSLRNPSRMSREGHPQQSVPPFMDPALPPPDPTFSASPEKSISPEKSNMSPEKSVDSGLTRSESFTLKKDNSYLTRSDSYIPPIWGGKPSEAYASQSLILKEDDSKASLQASAESPVHSYIPWAGWGRPSANNRTRTIIHGGSVFFQANQKEQQQTALSIVSDDTSKDVDPPVDSDTASEKSDVSDKALRVISPTASAKGFGSPAHDSTSPSPKRRPSQEVIPPPTPGEAFWRILWGLEPTPPKPRPAPRVREERVDERAISTRAVYDMFFGEDPCVDTTLPDRPTIVPSAARAGVAPASPPRPPLPPTNSQSVEPLIPHPSAPPVMNHAPGRRHPAGVPLPRQKSGTGVTGGPGPLPPRSPKPGLQNSKLLNPQPRSVRRLPRSPLASVSSTGSSGPSEEPDATTDNYRLDGDAGAPDSPQQSVTSERRSTRFVGDDDGGNVAESDAIQPAGDGRQTGVVESPNSVLPGHGPGWQGGAGPAYVSEVASCESPPHSRSGSSEWSDGPDDDAAMPEVVEVARADLSTLSLNGVLEPPGYEELFGDGPSLTAVGNSSLEAVANGGVVPEAGRAPVKGSVSPFVPKSGVKAIQVNEGKGGAASTDVKKLDSDIMVAVPLD